MRAAKLLSYVHAGRWAPNVEYVRYEVRAFESLGYVDNACKNPLRSERRNSIRVDLNSLYYRGDNVVGVLVL